MSDLGLTYSELQRALGVEAGWGRDPSEWDETVAADAKAIIKAGLSAFYTASHPLKPGKAIRWAFLFPTETLTTVAPYSTGTVEIVSGVVTLTGGTFPAEAATGELTVRGSSYTVASRDSGTQLTLDDTSVSVTAGAAYQIAFPIYDLPEDFSRIEGALTYRPGTALYCRPIELRSEPNLRALRQRGEWTGPPQYVAIRPKQQSQGAAQRWQLILYPTPNAAYPIEYRYAVNIEHQPYANRRPPGGPEHAQTVLAAVLAAYERRFSPLSTTWRDQFREELIRSVALNDDHAPDNLGRMRDDSDVPTGFRFQREAGPIYINGQLP